MLLTVDCERLGSIHTNIGCAACPKGRFGQSCKQECNCGMAECDPVSGECLCQPGYTGQKCLKGKFVANCQSVNSTITHFCVNYQSE